MHENKRQYGAFSSFWIRSELGSICKSTHAMLSLRPKVYGRHAFKEAQETLGQLDLSHSKDVLLTQENAVVGHPGGIFRRHREPQACEEFAIDNFKVAHSTVQSCGGEAVDVGGVGKSLELVWLSLGVENGSAGLMV